MQQLAITYAESITRKGEIKYFQIPLPGLSKRIIAVESSAFVFDALPIVQPQPPVNPAPVPPPPVNSNCPNPGNASIDPVSSTTAGSTTTQVFRIGAAVNPGFIYSCGVYSVTLSVVAVDGDTADSIATKLAAAVNNTSLVSWNQFGSNTRNFKPAAIANGDTITLTVDSQHSFFASGSGSCSGSVATPPAPALIQYDPLFFISNNDKAGRLSLQSPNATDIFYQCEVICEDKNTGLADFTLVGQPMTDWLRGKTRIAPEVNIQTESPILEAYYKDSLGVYYNQDISYQLNLAIWYEKQQTPNQHS